MALPLGHAAIGLTLFRICSNTTPSIKKRYLSLFLIILANLPDVDVVIGLLFRGNGDYFHRGPTHSILFALVMGFIASKAWRLYSKIPVINFRICFLLILSHILADYVFTTAPVSFLWPFEINWSMGHSGWGEVLSSIFFQAFQDAGIIIGCGMIVFIHFILKDHAKNLAVFIRKSRFMAYLSSSIMK